MDEILDDPGGGDSMNEALLVAVGDDSMEEEILLPKIEDGWSLLLEELFDTWSVVIETSAIFLMFFFRVTLNLKAFKDPYKKDARCPSVVNVVKVG